MIAITARVLKNVQSKEKVTLIVSGTVGSATERDATRMQM